VHFIAGLLLSALLGQGWPGGVGGFVRGPEYTHSSLAGNGTANREGARVRMETLRAAVFWRRRLRRRMFDGIDIEAEDAVNLVLPTRAPRLEPGQYCWINCESFLRLGSLLKR
jgi:hypothetical protein